MADNIDKISKLAALAEEFLAPVLPAAAFGHSALSAAARYSLFAPGKRFRPVLALLAGELLGIEPQRLASFAAALECLHAASLVHDDLPHLDNDSLRRGLPTCHVRFGAGPALLAGDALIARAFRVLAEDKANEPSTRNELAALLSSAFEQLSEGQVLDLESRTLKSREFYHSELDWLRDRSFKKTGALIAAACAGPALLLPAANLPEERKLYFDTLHTFGLHLGLLFQITDDILDVSLTSAELGKDANSDERAGTPNFVSVLGLERARREAENVAESAREILSPLSSTVISDRLNLIPMGSSSMAPANSSLFELPDQVLRRRR